MQVAKLYLRGSLCNQTLKGLNEQERTEIEEIINKIMVDPDLQQCRIEFCNALAWTIRNEYEDRSFGEQDYRVAIMKAAVAAIHGYAGKPPALEAITDPKQRKKWFQTWAFNYLRQILRENKLPTLKRIRTITLPADQAATHEIKQSVLKVIKMQHDHRHKQSLKRMLERAEVKTQKGGFLFLLDHWSFPIELVYEIKELSIKYLKHSIRISQVANGIEVKRSRKKPEKLTLSFKVEELVRMTSFDAEPKDGGDDGHRDRLETTAMRRRPTGENVMEETESINTLRDRVPDDARPVLQIYVEDSRPDDYIEQYGNSRPRISHVAKYLNKSPREVKRLLSIIQCHCLALGIGN